jgi:hypothetical protein
MGDLSDFERGQIVNMRFAGACITVSKVMSAYTNREKTTSAKRNSGQKSALTKTDLIRSVAKKSHNYCNIGDSRTQYPC